MRLSSLLLRRNTKKKLYIWQVGTKGPAVSTKPGKRNLKNLPPVTPLMLKNMRIAFDRERHVMQCLSTPYLTKEEDEFWYQRNDPYKEAASAHELNEQTRMPGKAKEIEGKTSSQIKRKGNVGNLLHSHRTIEQQFKDLSIGKPYDANDY